MRSVTSDRPAGLNAIQSSRAGNPVRILHVVEAFGLGGGIEKGIANLVRHLDPAGFEHILCAVFRLGPGLEPSLKERVQVVSLARQGGRFSIQALSLAAAIRRLKPDVVHSRNWGAIEAVAAARLAGVPCVIHSEHGVEQTGKEPFRRTLIRRAAYAMADYVFAVSEGLRDSIVSRTGRGTKMGVIRNGVDVDRFQTHAEARQRMRDQLGVAPGEFCIGCVGRLNPIKDYPTLIQAVSNLSRTCSKWRIFIAGTGPELESLQKLVSSLPGTSGRVHFTGALDCIPQFLAAMDSYVLPSLTEGISNSLLEAMASGLPVVATRTGGNPEVVVHNESGLLFEVGDANGLAEHLRAIISGDELRMRLGRGALNRVRDHFSIAAMVRQYEDLYTKRRRMSAMPQPSNGE